MKVYVALAFPNANAFPKFLSHVFVYLTKNMSTDQPLEPSDNIAYIEELVKSPSLPFMLQPKHWDDVCIITPERLRRLTHFITITLKPKLYKFSSITQFELSFPYVHHVLDQRDCIFVAEHTNQGNIHYHAMFEGNGYGFVSTINQLKKCKSLGHVHISPLLQGDMQRIRSYLYMCKSLVDNLKLLHQVRHKCIFYSNMAYVANL